MDNATLGPANAKLTEEGVVDGADVVMSLQKGAQASLRKHSSPTTARQLQKQSSTVGKIVRALMIMELACKKGNAMVRDAPPGTSPRKVP